MAGVLFRYYAACCMILIEITTQIRVVNANVRLGFGANAGCSTLPPSKNSNVARLHAFKNVFAARRNLFGHIIVACYYSIQEDGTVIWRRD